MTANPNASLETRQVLTYLTNLTGVLSGQQAAYNMQYLSSGFRNHVQPLHDTTGQWPALLGASYGHGATAQEVSDGNRVLIDWWNAGGLVTIHAPVNNPWTDGNQHDLSQRDLAQLINPNSAVYARWMTQLDELVAGLTQLRDAGVVVLWRPLHEMTFRDTFWWNPPTQAGFASFKDVWRHMFNHFARLDNLLWVYAASNSGPYPADAGYPGDDYVDIVGVDVYSDTCSIQGDRYERLTAFGKPFALCEFGPQPTRDGSYNNLTTLNAIRERYPETCYILQWHSWAENKVAIGDCRNAGSLLSDPFVVNRDGVNWRGVTHGGNLLADLTSQVEWMSGVVTRAEQVADRLEALTQRWETALGAMGKALDGG